MFDEFKKNCLNDVHWLRKQERPEQTLTELGSIVIVYISLIYLCKI